ncbi:hypothetical protein [Thiopseudomonas alkaliphila]|uniref:hypothetical protein n=1 Tax=Thiopseudomonas alkaliphila TaxID=1697053 RepID=UPI001E552B20|nr:hypothetical protein [Thiopseudomonas alkaliphila]
MDWNSLLDELWNYCASAPKELEAKLLTCLKGHSTEFFLGEIYKHIAYGQHDTAKQSLTAFLVQHPSAESIRRRLELILFFKKSRLPKSIFNNSKQRSKELLIKEVNKLVTTNELQAAEALLLGAIEIVEDSDYLNLLSRIYKLQYKPIAAAEASQKGLMLERQQQAFVETALGESDLPTDDDLLFFSSIANDFSSFDIHSSTEVAVSSGMIGESLSCSQREMAIFPPLQSKSWQGEIESTSYESSGSCKTKSKEATFPFECADYLINKPRFNPQIFKTIAYKPTLKLIRKPKKGATLYKENTVRAFNRFGQPVLIFTSTKPVKSNTVEDMNEGAATSYANDVQQVEQFDASFKNASQSESIDLEAIKAEEEYLESVHEYADVDDIYELNELSSLEIAGEQVSQLSIDEFSGFEDEYAAYAFDPYDSFERNTDDIIEPDEGFSDRVTREERALQKAAEFVVLVDWPRSTISLIQQIFIISGWGQTRLALEREIEKGVTPDELMLAAHIKDVWAENDIYWVAFNRNGSSQLSHQALSWPNALQIVRSFDSLPQPEEIEVLLEELFTSWYESSILRRSFKAFARYLWFRFANLESCLPANQHFDFCSPHELPIEEYSDLGLYDLLAIEEKETLCDYGIFQVKHPQGLSCYFSGRPEKWEEEE